MNKREESRRERETRRHEGRDRDEQRPRQHGTGYGRERAVYLEYIARKWQGSEPPTAEGYARALELWRRLPGATVTAATDLTQAEKSSEPARRQRNPEGRS